MFSQPIRFLKSTCCTGSALNKRMISSPMYSLFNTNKCNKPNYHIKLMEQKCGPLKEVGLDFINHHQQKLLKCLIGNGPLWNRFIYKDIKQTPLTLNDDIAFFIERKNAQDLDLAFRTPILKVYREICNELNKITIDNDFVLLMVSRILGICEDKIPQHIRKSKTPELLKQFGEFDIATDTLHLPRLVLDYFAEKLIGQRVFGPYWESEQTTQWKAFENGCTGMANLRLAYFRATKNQVCISDIIPDCNCARMVIPTTGHFETAKRNQKAYDIIFKSDSKSIKVQCKYTSLDKSFANEDVSEVMMKMKIEEEESNIQPITATKTTKTTTRSVLVTNYKPRRDKTVKKQRTKPDDSYIHLHSEFHGETKWLLQSSVDSKSNMPTNI